MFKKFATILFAVFSVSSFGIFKFCGAGFFGPEQLNEKLNSATTGAPYYTSNQTLVSDGRVRVQNKISCLKSKSAQSTDNNGDSHYGIGIQESVQIPLSYDAGTVFMNGWRLTYLNNDHHVANLSAAIINVSQQGRTLSWKAVGALSDKNGDDAYSLCYHYTLLFWKNSSRLNLHVNHSDENAQSTYIAPNSVDYTSTGFARPGVGNRVALLPRGFYMDWHDDNTGIFENCGDDDHHVKRFALKFGDINIVGNTDLYWSFATTFRDDTHSLMYYAGEVVSVLSGDIVRMIQPDLDIAVESPFGTPGYFRVVSRTVVEENLPFTYAIPVLTGWDLKVKSKTDVLLFGTSEDAHVRDIGAWIDNVSYDAGTGRLSYVINTVMHDNGSHGGYPPRYQVSILGINPKPVSYEPAGPIAPGPVAPGPSSPGDINPPAPAPVIPKPKFSPKPSPGLFGRVQPGVFR